MPKFRALALSCIAAVATVIAGCGGGGFNDTLYVTVSYPPDPVNLFSVSIIRPYLSGFDDHDPRCDQESGTVPPGMTINNDCTITGRPTRAGSFTFGYKVRAEDADGHFDNTETVTVLGPHITYLTASVAVNSQLQVAPRIDGWSAPTDGTVLTWSYALASGTLPPGLALDPVSGVISGQVTSTGSFSATIQATLTTTYGSYTAPAAAYSLQVF